MGGVLFITPLLIELSVKKAPAGPGLREKVTEYGAYETKRRRTRPARPTKPVPSSPRVPGSGTGGGGVEPVPDCEKMVTKLPCPWVHKLCVLQTMKCTPEVFDVVPVKFQVSVNPFPA